MNEQIYNHYINLINRRYKYDQHNQKRYGLLLKLMSWQYQLEYNNRPYHEEAGV